MKRRTFLARAGQAAALTALPRKELLGEDSFAALLTTREEETLAAVLEVLLPQSADSPGAADIGALGYILSVLTDSEVEESERIFLAKGVARLETFSKEQTKQSFTASEGNARGELLQAFVKSGDGESWVSNLLTYCLEAMFGDPVYGINRDEKGWKWVEHHPGFPRPPKRRWYRNV